MTMTISSPAFENGTAIPSVYTCDGTSVSPPLEWSDIPEGTQSLVLIMHDPDVPPYVRQDRRWDHWLVWNIDPTVTEFTEGEKPAFPQGATTSDTEEYYPPCPPDAEHRYFFTLYAVSAKIDLPQGSSRHALEEKMSGLIIAEAVLMGTYKRT